MDDMNAGFPQGAAVQHGTVLDDVYSKLPAVRLCSYTRRKKRIRLT